MRARLLLAAAACAFSLAHAGAPTGLQSDVVFSEYSPLSSSSEIARRSFGPLAFAEMTRTVSASGKQLREKPVDLTHETFSLYVPAQPPPQGYSLLVFVSPLDVARVPPSWQSVLDRHATIMVVASRAGNEQAIWDRRMPLALAGAFNVMQRYPVNPKRVYVGGFSGGSRVAMRLALDYPDLFHGALLNAGSDPIATPLAILPSAELFERFRRETQLVYVTGDEDSVNLEADISSRQSMAAWCVFGTSYETMFRIGHAAPPPDYLDKALTKLQTDWVPHADKLSSCSEHIAKNITDKLQHVRDGLHKATPQQTLKQLHDIDLRFGGLAAPESLELFRALLEMQSK